MPSSSTTNSSMTNNDRKRRGVSLSNTKKIRRSQLINNSKNERSLSISDSHQYSLTTENNLLRQLNDSYDKDNNDVRRDIDSNENMSSTIIIKQDEMKSSYDSDEEIDKIKQNSNKISSVVVSPIITSSDLTKKTFRSNNNSSTKLLKLVVPQSTNCSSSIKMLSNGDGLSSALRIPTKIQLTKTLSSTEKQQSIVDYPPTPPPPIIDNSHKSDENMKIISTISKRHSFSQLDCSLPPTSELSPTSLTSSSPDDSLVEIDLKLNRISSIKRRYRSLSSSWPILPYCNEKSQPITPPYKSKSLSRITNLSNKKIRSISPVIKYSSIERLKKRKQDQQIYGKKFKIKSKIENENIIIIKEILNEIIEQIQSINDTQFNPIQIEGDVLESRLTRTTVHAQAEYGDTTQGEEHMNHNHKKVLRRSKKSIHDENFPLLSLDLNENSFSIELKRQTSTPLSFHSVASSTTDDQSINSPSSVSKTHIFTDIVNELIKGAKGLDKLSCSLINFTNSIHNFIRLTNEKQTEKVENLQYELEKKCSAQLNRANIFCTKKIQYFINKHSIISINEYINEISLIIKYFYFYVLSLNYQKQENEYELILTDLINGKLTFINEVFNSSILTTIIEDFILTSSLANDYLSSQPIIINQNEYELPFIRNIEYENELLYKNQISLNGNPFEDLNDLENYLNSCEHISPTIPCYPVQQTSHPLMYNSNYTSPGQYYYPPTPSSDMTPYYYHPSYTNSAYNHPSSYYNPLPPHGIPYNEQFNYYYNQQTSYNSTNDIPLSNNNSHHQSYRRINQKSYTNQ